MPSRPQYNPERNYLPPDAEEYCYRILKPNGDFWCRNRMNRQYGDILTNCNQIAELLDKNPQYVLKKCYLRDVGTVKTVRFENIEVGDIVRYAATGIATLPEIKRANYLLSSKMEYKVLDIKKRHFKTFLMLSGPPGQFRSTLFEKVG